MRKNLAFHGADLAHSPCCVCVMWLEEGSLWDHMFLPISYRLSERWSRELVPAGGVTDRPMARLKAGWEGRRSGGVCVCEMEGGVLMCCWHAHTAIWEHRVPPPIKTVKDSRLVRCVMWDHHETRCYPNNVCTDQTRKIINRSLFYRR